MRFSFITSDKKFSGFFWTQFWGAFNDNFFKNSLVMLVAYGTTKVADIDQGSIVAIASGLFILPFFLFSPLAGQLADKYEKSKIVRWVKLCEIGIMFLAALGFIFESYEILFAILFFMGTQSTFFGPVKYSIIPQLVKEEELTEGTALIELGTFLSILLGTIAGGAMESLPNAPWIISAGVLIFAGIGYLSARKVPEVSIGEPGLKVQWNPFPEFISLWKIIRQKVAIFNTVVAISWFWFFGTGVLSVLPIYVKDFLMGNSHIATLFLAMFTLGVGVGSILCERMSYQRVEIGLVPIGSLGLSVFVIDLFFAGTPFPDMAAGTVTIGQFVSTPHAWRLMFDFFMMSVFGGIFIVPLYALLQERSDPETRSRVIAGANVMNALFMVVASITLLVFYHFQYTTSEILATFGIMNFVVAFYIYTVVPEFTLRFYSWVLSRIIYSIDTKGIKHIPRNGAFVLVSNHVTFVDWLILAGACKRPVSFVMYFKFFKIPVIRYLMKQAKVIPIAGAKESLEIMNKAFDRISSDLKEGTPVCIFPEGTLTKDGKLNPFRPGLMKMLEKDPVPVVPVVIHGLWRSLFSKADKKDRAHRRKLTVEFFPPITAADVSLEKLEDIIAGELGETPPYKRETPK